LIRELSHIPSPEYFGQQCFWVNHDEFFSDLICFQDVENILVASIFRGRPLLFQLLKPVKDRFSILDNE